MRRVEIRDTAYQQVEVWKSADEVEFRVAGAIHAWFHRERFLTGQAWDLIAAAALLGRGKKPGSILMLGLAGGTSFRTLRHLLPGCRLTAIDIDAEIVGLARQHMELGNVGAEIIIADAYDWLRGNRRKFDVVIDDIYLAGREDVFRPREADDSSMALMKSAISPGGLFAMNLVTGTGHRRMQSASRSLMKSTFPSVRALRTPQAQNEVIVGGDDVCASGVLADHLQGFSEPCDREYWTWISDRKLR